MSYEFERMFNEEIRDKKRTATGVYHRASRRGYVGTIRTQVDFLKGKEKKKYMWGEIKVSNMYEKLENIPQIAELENMELEKAQNIIKIARKNFKNKQLYDHWNVTSYTFYNIVLPRFKIREPFPSNAPDYKKGSGKKGKKKADEKVINEVALTTEIKQETQEVIKAQEVIKERFGLTLGDNGIFTGNNIVDRLQAYLLILKENSKYKLNLKIEEIE